MKATIAMFVASAMTIMLASPSLAGGERAPELPLEDFFRLPTKTAYRLSPDGTHYAFLQPWEDRLNIHVAKIGEGGQEDNVINREGHKGLRLGKRRLPGLPSG